jgi:predicted dehydrogenase
MSKYRVGISGLRRGLNHARVFASLPECEVTAAHDPNPRRLNAFGAEFPTAALCASYAELLGFGIDIAVVASPLPAHCPQTIQALEAGCHVLQEIPLGTTLDQCHTLLDAVKAHPTLKFMLAENCCYWAHILSWREMVRSGQIGTVAYAEAEYIHDVRSLMRDRPSGLHTWRASLPPIHYCTHSLGPLLWVTGDRCVTACGMASPSRLDPELASADLEVGLFRTANDAVFKVLCGFKVVREPAFHYYSIYGTAGCLETTRPPSATRTHAYLQSIPHLHNMIEIPVDENVPHASSAARLGGHGTAEHEMVRAFVQAIRDDTDPPIDIYLALEMSLPGLCAHESALQGGQPVTVPDWR